MTGPGLPAGTGADYGAHYAYLPQTTLVGQVDIRDESANVRLRTVRAYEPNRDLIDYVENVWRPNGTPATISKYDYTSDALGRRTNVDCTGVAFGSPTPPIAQPFGYNDRNELTSSSRGAASWGYAYDPIGNRKTYTTEGPVTTTYTSNKLNQYDRWDRPGSPGVLARQRYTYDEDGNLVQTWIAGDMNCDGLVNAADINLFQAAILMGKTWWETTYPNWPYLNGDINGDGLVDFGDINPFTSLMAAGNAAADQTFVWDAENRLVEVRPTTPGDGDRKVVFGYDQQGRRVDKRVYDWAGPGPDDWAATPAERRKFVWSGRLMLLELDEVFGQDAVLRKYTWGLDLAGLNGAVGQGSAVGRGSALPSQNAGLPPRRASSGPALQGAGGIGGLLAVQAPGAGPGGGDLDAVYTYDVNGNVGQLVAWATDFGGAQGDEWHPDRLVAHYEYEPYGGVTAQSGYYAAANPMRFSTKYWDDETELGYWGYRYYSPALGRWISRDPIEETGGLHLFASMDNDPLNAIDPLGQYALAQGRACCVCGPDVTAAVHALMADIDAQFAAFKAANPNKVSALCRAYIGAGNWDSDLYTRVTVFKTSNCPRGGPPCALDWTQTGGKPGAMGGMPVTFNGGCYASFDVNYVVYGRMARNCDNFYTALFWFRLYKHPNPWNTHTYIRFTQANDWWFYAYGRLPQPSPPQYLKACAPCKEQWGRPISWRAGSSEAQISGNGGSP